MNKSVKFLSLLAAGAVVAGCQDYDLGMSVDEIRYKKNFEEAFGKIDPEQDFNLATRSAVTVDVSRESEIKVYAKYGRNYRLVADYQGVTGTQTLEFDVVEGTTDIRVSDGSMAFETTVGSSVSFAGTRGIFEIPNISTKTSDYLEMSEALVKAWVPIIPERDAGKRTIDSAPQKYLYSYSNFGSLWNLRDSSDFSSLTYFSLMDSKKSRIS